MALEVAEGRDVGQCGIEASFWTWNEPGSAILAIGTSTVEEEHARMDSRQETEDA